MPKVTYSGNGITAIGVDFIDGTTYDLSDKSSKYLLDTFPAYFTLGGKAPKVEAPVVPIKVEEEIVEPIILEELVLDDVAEPVSIEEVPVQKKSRK